MKVLVLVEDYPSNTSHEMMYVHVRNKYYLKNGIYSNSIKQTNIGPHGKIDWKKTIKLSDKIISEEGVFYCQFYRKKKIYEYDIVSDLMVYSINYTIKKLSFIFNFRPILDCNVEYVENLDMNYIIKTLSEKKREVFSDSRIKLINCLIDFYKNINNGGDYHIKIYNFQYVWQEMVEVYLNNYFLSAEMERIIFSTTKITDNSFKKGTFVVDESGKKIEPDHYFEKNNYRYIFDSKYYEEIKGINYKQLSYQFLLTNFFGNSNDEIIFIESEKRWIYHRGILSIFSYSS